MLDLGNRESIYQPRQQGLTFPHVPTFDRVEDERRHLKERLVGACRAFALQGFDYGFAGHLTIRDPEHPHLYWTNPMAVHFRQVRMSNLILVDHEGTVVEGDYAVNQAGFVLHGAVAVTGLSVREFLISAFLFVTAPIAAHLMARAAIRRHIHSIAPPPESLPESDSGGRP